MSYQITVSSNFTLANDAIMYAQGLIGALRIVVFSSAPAIVPPIIALPTIVFTPPPLLSLDSTGSLVLASAYTLTTGAGVVASFTADGNGGFVITISTTYTNIWVGVGGWLPSQSQVADGMSVTVLDTTTGLTSSFSPPSSLPFIATVMETYPGPVTLPLSIYGLDSPTSKQLIEYSSYPAANYGLYLRAFVTGFTPTPPTPPPGPPSPTPPPGPATGGPGCGCQSPCNCNCNPPATATPYGCNNPPSCSPAYSTFVPGPCLPLPPSCADWVPSDQLPPPPAGPQVLQLQALLQRWLIWANMTYPNYTYATSLGTLPQDTYNALNYGKPCGC